MEEINGVNSSTGDALLEQEKNDDAMRCWSRNCELLDMEEAKAQVLFSLPMIITNVCYYFIPLISVMFAGHLGQLQLASSNLANSWATVTGFLFMVGLSGALETLCGQAYGARLYRMLGIYLQAYCIISVLFSLIISTLWIYTEPILVFYIKILKFQKQLPSIYSTLYRDCLHMGFYITS